MARIFFGTSFYGKKIVRVRNVVYDIIVGATSSEYETWYRYPASFRIPPDDPQYAKDGNGAMGVYGYMLNTRCWSYDTGLALLVLTTAGENERCMEMLHRMQQDQNPDGSWNFSYDLYIGKLFHDYTRTGSVGWLLWGACYAVLQMGKTGQAAQFLPMLEKGGDWLLHQQVLDKADPRYGLLRGGYGSYNSDYSYTAEQIEWCSTEHNCSSLQALHGLALVTGKSCYRKAAERIKKALTTTLYDTANRRFYQGITAEGTPDTGWALDCTTWAGLSALSTLSTNIPTECRKTTNLTYVLRKKSLTVSSSPNNYNQTYSSTETFSGFKPYSDKTADYAGAPETIWSEGTLGYVALCMAVGKTDDAQKYMDEMIKLQNCDGANGGLLYVTKTYAALPWEFHMWESVASTAWLYLCIKAPELLFPQVLTQATQYRRFRSV